MKLYFVNRFFYPDFSATSQLLTDLATGLVGEFDVTVVTSRRLYNDPLARLDRRDRHGDVHILRLNTTRLGRARLWRRALDYLTFYLGVMWWLARHVGPGDVAVLMTDPPLLQLINTAIVRIKGGKVVNWLQDLFPEIAIELGAFPYSRFLSAPLIWWRNRALKAAEANVVISRKMQEFLAGQDVTGTHVIPNWADGERIRPLDHSTNALRAEWNPENRFLVGYSGNFGRAHTFDELLEAMSLLDSREEIHFVLIGEGAGLEPLLEAVERKRLRRVRFHPYQSQDTLRQSLGAIDLHIVTLKERMEGLVFPSKVYGVLAAGRPLAFIGEPGGEIAQLVDDNGIGFAMRHGDGAGLAEQIQRLAHDPESLRRMGANARALFDREYAKTHSIDRWRALLQTA